MRRSADCLHQVRVGPVGYIYQSAIVVFSIVSSGQVLVAPLEPGSADQSWVRICLFCIVAECYTALLLGVNLPERLGHAPVDGAEVVFTNDHWQAGSLGDLVHELLFRIEVIAIEAEDIEYILADGNDLLFGNMAEPHPEVEMVRVVVFNGLVDRLEEDPEGIKDKLPPFCGSITTG